MVQGIPVTELDAETMARLGLSTTPSLEQTGNKHLSLGRVLKALKGIGDKDALWVLDQAKSCVEGKEESSPPVKKVGPHYVPPIRLTLEVVARYFRVTPQVLKQRGRVVEIVEARQVAMYILWSSSGYSLSQIGKALGGRSPATVSHGFQKIAKQVAVSTGMGKKVTEIKGELYPQ